ncbi:MAG: hypothetical protein HY015_05870 [Bacteroidetes bacterium]|nr:hypothetical protein [Bacteroidota bacterium]MBI3482489.1 hypothetical protein [Bacteroidota bacterium]
MKTTIQSKIVRGIMMILLILLVSKSFAQSKGRFGLELSLGTPHYRLQSNVAQLKNLRTSYLGANIGGVYVNSRNKVKVMFGLFGSDDSVPYPIDLMQGGASWSLYLLPARDGKAHLFEPYVVVGANFLRSRFYGNYLNPDITTNYSSTNAPYLGQSAWVFGNVGLGVEYQMENEAFKFIHLFMQATYGFQGISMFSGKAFSQTVALGSVSYSFGINFAISKIVQP